MVLVSHLFLFIHVFIITIACSRWPWKLENKADVRSSISPGRVSYSGSHWLVLWPLARLAVQCKHMLPLQVRLVRKGWISISQPHYQESSLMWWVSCAILLAVEGEDILIAGTDMQTQLTWVMPLPCWHVFCTCWDMGWQVQLNSFLVFLRVHSFLKVRLRWSWQMGQR